MTVSYDNRLFLIHSIDINGIKFDFLHYQKLKKIFIPQSFLTNFKPVLITSRRYQHIWYEGLS